MTPRSSPLFINLPLEIRYKIYDYVLPSRYHPIQGPPSDEDFKNETRTHKRDREVEMPLRCTSRPTIICRTTTRCPIYARELLPVSSDIKSEEAALDPKVVHILTKDETRKSRFPPPMPPRMRPHHARFSQSEQVLNVPAPADRAEPVSAELNFQAWCTMCWLGCCGSRSIRQSGLHCFGIRGRACFLMMKRGHVSRRLAGARAWC
jgi:hypothetical protein